MADTSDMTLNTQKGDKGKAKKSLRKKVLIVCLSIVILVGAAVPAYMFFMGKRPAKLTTSTLPVEVLAFCFEKLPDLYAKLLSMDEEIRLTQKEIKRITTLGDTYPEQKKIADTELKGWTANLNILTKGLAEYEKTLKVFYVSYRVNAETGQALIDEKKEELEQKIDAVIVQSKTMTDKLRAILEARSFFEKTKDRFLDE